MGGSSSLWGISKLIRKGKNLRVVGLVLKTKTGAPIFLTRSVEKLSI
jgi:hypothetical protein